MSARYLFLSIIFLILQEDLTEAVNDLLNLNSFFMLGEKASTSWSCTMIYKIKGLGGFKIG